MANITAKEILVNLVVVRNRIATEILTIAARNDELHSLLGRTDNAIAAFGTDDGVEQPPSPAPPRPPTKTPRKQPARGADLKAVRGWALSQPPGAWFSPKEARKGAGIDRPVPAALPTLVNSGHLLARGARATREMCVPTREEITPKPKPTGRGDASAFLKQMRD